MAAWIGNGSFTPRPVSLFFSNSTGRFSSPKAATGAVLGDGLRQRDRPCGAAGRRPSPPERVPERPGALLLGSGETVSLGRAERFMEGFLDTARIEEFSAAVNRMNCKNEPNPMSGRYPGVHALRNAKMPDDIKSSKAIPGVYGNDDCRQL